MARRLQVECYAGYKADERPARFSFVRGSNLRQDSPIDSSRAGRGVRKYQVAAVLDRWYGPGYECFKVRADDGNLYVLRHELGEDTWRLDAFRADRGAT